MVRAVPPPSNEGTPLTIQHESHIGVEHTP